MTQLKGGFNTSPSYIALDENNNITMKTRNTVTTNSLITLDSSSVNITGSLTCLNFGVKSPIYFTTNRNMTINGVVFSVYDIDLTKYTKSPLLDGLNIRQFRIRTWLSDADYEYPLNSINKCDIFMSNKMDLVFIHHHSLLKKHF